jgi:pimeloyl-ACP methyl ester carboxylesterase
MTISDSLATRPRTSTRRLEFPLPSGITLVGDAGGTPASVPVILLHGGGQTRSAWGKAAAILARAGYCTLALDLRGHGESGWAADGRYDLDVYAEDLRHIAATFDQPPVLVGASLGGLTSLAACAEAPRILARALVLVDIAVRIDTPGTVHIQRFMRETLTGFDTIAAAADAVADYLPHRPRPKDTSGLLKNLRQRDDGRLSWHWDPQVVTPSVPWDPRVIEPRLERAAASIEVPTLLVRGGSSDVVSAEAAEEFKQLLPHAEIAEIAAARHMVAGDDNDAFNGAILDFIRRNAPLG